MHTSMKALCGYVVPEMLHIMTVYAALSVYVGLRIHVLPPSRNIIKDLAFKLQKQQ
jgi:hypothetical protein